jgi:hypothetical protein
MVCKNLYVVASLYNFARFLCHGYKFALRFVPSPAVDKLPYSDSVPKKTNNVLGWKKMVTQWAL